MNLIYYLYIKVPNKINHFLTRSKKPVNDWKHCFINRVTNLCSEEEIILNPLKGSEQGYCLQSQH